MTSFTSSNRTHACIVSLQASKAGSAANQSIFGEWDDASYSRVEAYLAEHSIEILSASEEDGQRHVVADGVLSNDHCANLIQLDVIISCISFHCHTDSNLLLCPSRGGVL